MRSKCIKLTVWLTISAFCLTSISPVYAQESSSDSATLREKKDSEGYILNLKDLIDKSRDKIEKVNDKLKDQAKQRRNMQREEKAREYYEKAMRLFEENKLEQAQELWEKAIKITEHPEMKGYIRESIKKSKKKEAALQQAELRRLKRLEIDRGYSIAEVEAAYDMGVALFQQKKWLSARHEFENVDEMFPDHKATRSYIMIIDQEIQKEQQAIIDEKLREEAIARRKEKEAWKAELERKEKELQETTQDKAERTYQEAFNLHSSKQYRKAKDKFKEVEWIVPNYKKTLDYLARIDTDIAHHDMITKEEKQRQYEEQLKQERLAKEREQELVRLRERKEEEEKIRRMREEADFVYNSALSLYKNKFYEKSEEKFKEVQAMAPGYKSTEKYLKRIDKVLDSVARRLEAQERAAQEEKLKELQQATEAEEAARVREAKEAKMAVKNNEGEKDKAAEEVKKPIKKPIKEAAAAPAEFQTPEKDLAAFKQEAARSYKTAIRMYKDKQYEQARDKFIEVSNLSRDYKSTEKYLARIDKKLKDQQGELREKQAQAVTQLLSKEDDEVRRAIEDRQKELSSQAEAKFNQGVEFYKSQNYIEAKRKFIAVEALSPGYKETLEYLGRIDDQINKINRQPQPDKKILKSKRAWNNENFEENISAKQTKELKKSGEPSKIPVVKAAQESGPASANTVIADAQVTPDFDMDVVYDEAIALYRAEQYMHARMKFEQVMSVDPKFKKAKSYLRSADRRWKNQQKRAAKKKTATQEVVEDLRRNLGGEERVVKELTPKELEKFEYQMKQDRRVAQLKAKEDHIEYLKKQKFKEYKQLLKNEEVALKKLKKERENKAQEVRRNLREKLKEEKIAKQKAKKELEKLEREKEKELALIEQAEAEAAAKEERLEQLKQKIEPKVESFEEVTEFGPDYQQKQAHINNLRQQELKIIEQIEALSKQISFEEKALFDKREEERKKAEEQALAKAQDEVVQAQESIRQEKEKLAEIGIPIEPDENTLLEMEAKKLKELRKRKEAKAEIERIRETEIIKQREQKKILARERKKIQKELEKHEKQQRAKWQSDVEQLYAEAVELYQQGHLAGAKSKFSIVENLQPGYGFAGEYAERIRIRLIKDKKEIEKRAEIEARKEIKKEQQEKLVQERIEAQRIKEEEERIAKEKKDEEERVAKEKKDEEERVAREKKEEEERAAKEKREEERRLAKEKKEQERMAKKKKTEEKDLAKQKEQEEQEVKQKEQQQAAAKQAQEDKLALKDPAQSEKFQEVIKEQEKTLEEKRIEVKEDLKKRATERAQLLEGQKVDEKLERKLRLKKEREEAQLLKKIERQEEMARRIAQKEAQRLARKQERDERLKREIEEKKLKRDLEQTYNDALKLYKADKIALSREKFKKFESMLASGQLDQKYITKLRKQLIKDRAKLEEHVKNEAEKERQRKLEEKLAKSKKEEEKELEQEKLRAQKQSFKEKEGAVIVDDAQKKSEDVSEDVFVDMSKEDRQKEEMREKELAQLRKKIQEDEARLEKERAKQARVEQIESRKDEVKQIPDSQVETKALDKKAKKLEKEENDREWRERLAQKKLEENMQKRKAGIVDSPKEVKHIAKIENDDKRYNAAGEIAQRARAEENKRKELEELVKRRQAELKEERERIQKEFERNMEDLYGKAIDLHRRGLNDQARKIFMEIDSMRPGYKKTEDYLQKIPMTSGAMITRSTSKSIESQPVMVDSRQPIQKRSSVVADALDAFEQNLQSK